MAALTLRERLDLRRFLRGDRPVAGPIVLSHQRIFIVPNWRGLGLALLLLVQWLAAINYNNNLAFILSFLLVAVVLTAILHGYRNLAGLGVRPRPAKPVFAGEQAGFELVLANPSAAARYAVWLKTPGATPVRADVPAFESTAVVLGLRTERRGWLVPGTLTVYTEFPLGLLYAWSPLNFSERILVYPAVAADPLPFPQGSGHGRQSLERHNAEEFAGFKRYEPGDPTRRIHWKAVAKGRPPVVRRYAGEHGDDVLLSLDEAPGPDLEARLSRLCRWVLDAEAGGLRYGLRLPGLAILPRHGAAHCRRCLEALAVFGQ
jgi:uncharacterized protein (DUF58 family)